jgi:hypothetical protein
MARPTDYTPELAALICAEMAEGKSLRSICEREAMPDKSTVFRWLADRKEFRRQYAHAMAARADLFAEEIIEIADDASDDSATVIARARLRVDTRKWLMARMAPKKYGGKAEKAVGEADPVVHTVLRIERVIVPANAVEQDATALPAEGSLA